MIKNEINWSVPSISKEVLYLGHKMQLQGLLLLHKYNLEAMILLNQAVLRVIKLIKTTNQILRMFRLIE